MNDSTLENIPRRMKYLKHGVAVFVIGYPVTMLLYFWIRNPNFLFSLLSPDSNQPMGWFIFILLLASLAINYLLILIVCNLFIGLIAARTSKRAILGKSLIVFFLVLASYFLKSFSLYCAVFGPSLLLLIDSPVGRMFFGQG